MKLQVTYAQNYEDIRLARVLDGQSGFYIDVGAAHPEHGSVTAMFYRRGWRGINVEPQLAFHHALCHERPEDINLRTLVSNKRGLLPLYVIAPRSGKDTIAPPSLSATVDPDLAERYRRDGYVVRELRIETRTLTDICAEHCAEREIGFLSIDAEGHEREVLEGADLRRWRPRVVVVEATVPNTRQPSHLAWEHLVIDVGYAYATFDGLNRYYVRAEDRWMIEGLRESIGLFDGQIIPEWLVRTIAQIVGLYAADDASGEPQSTKRAVAELFRLAGENPAALPVLLEGPYRSVLTDLVRASSHATSSAASHTAPTPS